MTDKSPRTIRSKRLRSLLWIHSGGLCAICGGPLDPDRWDAHHDPPWRTTKDTNVHDMRATHPHCNRSLRTDP